MKEEENKRKKEEISSMTNNNFAKKIGLMYKSVLLLLKFSEVFLFISWCTLYKIITNNFLHIRTGLP